MPRHALETGAYWNQSSYTLFSFLCPCSIITHINNDEEGTVTLLVSHPSIRVWETIVP